MATQKKQILQPDPAKRKKMSGKFDIDYFEPMIWSTLALNPQFAKVDENFLREHECTPGEYDKNWFEVLT